MSVAEVSIVPVGTASASVSEHVAKAVSVLARSSRVKYRVVPMGTTIEGELADILDVIKRMHEAVFDSEVRRVVTHIAIDDRRDKAISMESKVRSVLRKLDRQKVRADVRGQ